MVERATTRTAAPMTGLSHVQFVVSDLQASVEWYTIVLGLDHYVGSVDAGYVALRHPGAGVVVVLSARPGAAPPPGASTRSAPPVDREPVTERLDHLAFAVPDGVALGAWADHLTEAGIDHPGVVLERGNPSLQLRDPDGTSIELVAPGPRSA